MKLAIINGPNLNLLGIREKDVYGNMSFEDFLETLRTKFPDITLEYYQSNLEGELINEIQEKGFTSDGIILNAGGYTHTSVAIADAVKSIKASVVEVHISNIFAREDFRHISYMGKNCIGSISGFGLKSYELAIRYFLDKK
jgi:3-dehydroquinate dehydratase-2